MTRFRSNVMRIFAASVLVLFVSQVKNACAQDQDQSEVQNQEVSLAPDNGVNEGPSVDVPGVSAEAQEGPNDEVAEMDSGVNEGPSKDVQGASEVAQGGQNGEVADMDGANNDSAFHDAQADEDRTQDQQNDEQQDVAPAPPAAQ